MPLVDATVRRLGGIATTAELLGRGITPDLIRMAVDYGTVVRIRRGWVANVDVPERAIAARRVGGQLACVSALDHHGVLSQTDHALHIAVPARSSRLRPGRETVVLHWSRADPTGDRLAVSIEEAWKQAAACRALDHAQPCRETWAAGARAAGGGDGETTVGVTDLALTVRRAAATPER